MALICLFIAGGKAHSACLETYEAYKGTAIQANILSEAGDCFITITPMYYKDMRYRSYLFSSNGLMMVFLSLGHGPEHRTTGAREFYFPSAQAIKQTDQITYSTSGPFIYVRLSDQIELQFDAETADLIGIKNGKITNNPLFSAQNLGGIEILAAPVLLLDSGFKMASAPSADKKRKSTFVDIAGAKCEVENSEVFRWQGSGDVYLRYKGAAFERWFSQKCPLLKN